MAEDHKGQGGYGAGNRGAQGNHGRSGGTGRPQARPGGSQRSGFGGQRTSGPSGAPSGERRQGPSFGRAGTGRSGYGRPSEGFDRNGSRGGDGRGYRGAAGSRYSSPAASEGRERTFSRGPRTEGAARPHANQGAEGFKPRGEYRGPRAESDMRQGRSPRTGSYQPRTGAGPAPGARRFGDESSQSHPTKGFNRKENFTQEGTYRGYGQRAETEGTASRGPRTGRRFSQNERATGETGRGFQRGGSYGSQGQSRGPRSQEGRDFRQDRPAAGTRNAGKPFVKERRYDSAGDAMASDRPARTGRNMRTARPAAPGAGGLKPKAAVPAKFVSNPTYQAGDHVWIRDTDGIPVEFSVKKVKTGMLHIIHEESGAQMQVEPKEVFRHQPTRKVRKVVKKTPVQAELDQNAEFAPLD